MHHSTVTNQIDKDHIYAHRHSYFTTMPVRTQQSSAPTPPSQLHTNHRITLTHPYAFLLLHLKASSQTLNKLGISIPEVSIFYKQKPYDIIYQDKDDIRGLRDTEKVTLKKVYDFFLKKSKEKKIHKQEQCIACFQGAQYLLLSDTDLLINCHKLKGDPFFTKLLYIQNRMDFVESRILVNFNDSQDCQFRGLAIESFLGFKNNHQIYLKYGRNLYLKYLTEKISLFINIEQNIRIKSATFIFSRSSNNTFYFVDVQNLIYQNLTQALKVRQKNLQKRQKQLTQKLIMSQSNYQKYKSRKSQPNVKAIEKSMNDIFYSTAKQYNVQLRKRTIPQTSMNQIAFNKLFPSHKNKMQQTLGANRFKDFRKKMLCRAQRHSFKKEIPECSKQSTKIYEFKRRNKTLN